MAALKKVVVLQVALLVLVLAVSARAADRVDFFEPLSSTNQKSVDSYKRSDIPACCDNCVCTKSIPPQCSCLDIFIGIERCENCKKCLCALSFPPQCRCLDIKDFCDPPCSSSSSAQIIKEVAA